MGSGYSKMKKQAKAFQEQMAKMQDDMQKLEVTGSAGNGLVQITLSGEKEIKKLFEITLTLLWGFIISFIQV